MSNKLRVLCVHPALAPYRVDLFNVLSEHVDLTVVFLQENLQTQNINQAEVRKEIKFTYLFALRGFSFKGRIFRFGLNKIINEICPDVVIGFEFSPTTLSLCLFREIGLGRKYKLWTTTDDRVAQIVATRGLRKIFRNFILRHVDGCIVTDNSVAYALKSAIARIDRLMFAAIPIVHDTEMIRVNETSVLGRGERWRMSLDLASNEKIMLFVGRLVPIKNLQWLIAQMVQVPKYVRLVVVGDGCKELELKRIVSEQSLSDRVKFVGRREGELLYAVMSAADVLVLCSHSETYGAVVAEALQWGVPCLVNDRCGASVILNEKNGRVFRYNDSEDFRSKLNEVLVLPKGKLSLLPVDLRQSVLTLVEMMHEDA